MGNLVRKKIANHTYLVRDGKTIHVKFYDTNIISFFPNGSYQLTTGGWRTATTAERMRRFLHHGIVWFKDKALILTTQRGHFYFKDGIRVSPTGRVTQSGGEVGKVNKDGKKLCQHTQARKSVLYQLGAKIKCKCGKYANSHSTAYPPYSF